MINTLRILSLFLSIVPAIAAFDVDYWYTDPADYFPSQQVLQAITDADTSRATVDVSKVDALSKSKYESIASEYKEVMCMYDKLLARYGDILSMHGNALSMYDGILCRHEHAWQKYKMALSRYGYLYEKPDVRPLQFVALE